MRIKLSDHFTYSKLLRFTLPSIVTSVFISLYGVVDGLFITNFTGKSALAALNFVYPILNILGVFGYMVGAGGSALVAKSLGEKKTEKSNQLFSMFVYLCIAIGLLLTIVGFLILRPMLILFGAGGLLLEKALEYGYVILMSLTFWNLQYLFQIFFVTSEKPKLGLYVTIFAGVTNMVTDALFIAVLKWGLVGAAAATALGQIVGGGIPMIYFFRKNDSLLRLGKTKFDVQAIIKGISNGTGELLSGISASIVGILYNSQLLKYAGEDGVAAYGIMMYINMIFTGISLGYMSGSAPIIAYHYGANNHQELKNLLKKGVILLISSSMVMYVLSILLSVPLSQLFAGYDTEFYNMTLHGFKIFAISFLFMGIAFLGSSFFTALNNGLIAAILSFLRTFVFQVLSVVLLPMVWGIDGIWYSVVVAQGLAMICTVAFFVGMRKKYQY